MQFLPDEKRKILECKRLRLLEKMIIDEGYPDKTLPGDIAQGFWLVGQVGHAPSSSGILPARIGPYLSWKRVLRCPGQLCDILEFLGVMIN